MKADLNSNYMITQSTSWWEIMHTSHLEGLMYLFSYNYKLWHIDHIISCGLLQNTNSSFPSFKFLSRTLHWPGNGLFTEAFLVDYSTERFQAMNKGLAEKGPTIGCPRNLVSMVSYNPLKYMGYIPLARLLHFPPFIFVKLYPLLIYLPSFNLPKNSFKTQDNISKCFQDLPCFGGGYTEFWSSRPLPARICTGTNHVGLGGSVEMDAIAQLWRSPMRIRDMVKDVAAFGCRIGNIEILWNPGITLFGVRNHETQNMQSSIRPHMVGWGTRKLTAKNDLDWPGWLLLLKRKEVQGRLKSFWRPSFWMLFYAAMVLNFFLWGYYLQHALRYLKMKGVRLLLNFFGFSQGPRYRFSFRCIWLVPSKKLVIQTPSKSKKIIPKRKRSCTTIDPSTFLGQCTW